MKKIFSFILAAVFMLVFSGCSEDSSKTINDVYQSVSEIQETDISEITSGSVPSPETEDSKTDSPPETENIISETVPEETVSLPDDDPVSVVTQDEEETQYRSETFIDESGSYTSKEDVALYIHTYGRLPDNFITKKEAESLGWSGGSLEPYASGKCIGGSRFGNYEGLLPEKDGRKYTECDIDTLGAKSRGAKRIVFSDDGLIYYTEDHYESFELLYGDEE